MRLLLRLCASQSHEMGLCESMSWDGFLWVNLMRWVCESQSHEMGLCDWISWDGLVWVNFMRWVCVSQSHVMGLWGSISWDGFVWVNVFIGVNLMRLVCVSQFYEMGLSDWISWDGLMWVNLMRWVCVSQSHEMGLRESMFGSVYMEEGVFRRSAWEKMSNWRVYSSEERTLFYRKGRSIFRVTVAKVVPWFLYPRKLCESTRVWRGIFFYNSCERGRLIWG